MTHNKIHIKWVGISLLILLLAGSTFFAYSRLGRKKVVIDQQVKKTVDTLFPYKVDTVALKRFQSVYESIDVNKNEFLLMGSLKAINGADLSERINNEAYIYSRKGNEFYFKLGKTEIFNNRTLAVYVDHLAKTVLIKASNTVAPISLMPNINQLVTSIMDEGYDVRSNLINNMETIRLINFNHMSCKEYSLTFDSKTLKATKLHLTISNSEEPENKKLDQQIDLSLSEVSDKSNIGQFLAMEVVFKENNTWKLSKAFQNYQLINKL